MKNIYKAIAGLQQECPVIVKDTKGYGYVYADLPAVFETINPLMKKYGLGFYQAVDGESITTVVFHIESAETIESTTCMPLDSLIYEESVNAKGEKKTVIKGFEGMNKAQAIGSLITYFRRYTISSLLGLVTDKDTDGSGVKVEKKTVDEGAPF